MSIKLKGSSDGSVSFDAPADTSPSGSDITLTLPTSAGSANQFLKNSGIAGELEYSSMVETSTGVGVGTSSPQRDLHIHNADSSTNTYLQLTSATTGTGSTDGFQLWAYGSGSSSNAAIVQRENAALEIWTNNTERARLDSSGRLILGTTTAPSVGSTQFKLSISGEDFAGSGKAQVRYQSATAGPSMLFAKARGTTASPSIVQNGDQLGKIRFYGYDGSDFASLGAEIAALVGGTPGSNDMPGLLVFSTTADGASSPSERMRLDQGGTQHNYRPAAGTVIISRTGQSGFSASTFRGYESASSITTGTVSFVVYANGNVQNKNNSYGQISDVKLKKTS